MTSCYRERIRNSILDYFDNNGIVKTKQFCIALLESDKYKSNIDFRSAIHGEICETYLECVIKNFIKTHNLNDWFYTKGIVVKDLNTKLHYTEIDIVLYTPHTVILFECKSYSGTKVLENQCTIKRPNSSYNVYKQQINHLNTLRTNIDSCYSGVGDNGYRLVLFMFSLGDTLDKRTDKWKKLLPCLNDSNIEKFLETFINKKSRWDIDRLKKFTDIIMKNNINLKEEHLEYVKKLKET